MADKVETMAYAGEVPWHKKGVPVSNKLTPLQMAKAALGGEIWTMEMLPVYNDFKGKMQVVPNKFNLTRMTDGFVMDTCSALYHCTQPEEAFDFFKRFVMAGKMRMETGGSLDNGRRIWALASIDSSFTLKGGDTVKGYLLLCSPNKAGECMTIKFCSTRVVCWNTIAIALQEGGKTVRLNHLTNFDERRQNEAIEALGMAVNQLSTFEQQAKLLSTQKAKREQVIQYVAAVSKSKLLDAAADSTVQQGARGKDVLNAIVAAETSTVHIQRAFTEEDLNRAGKSILEAIANSPGSDLPSARIGSTPTWWGALNGVTYAVDHQLGKEETRLSSAWYGEKATMKTRALDLAVDYAMQTA
jgi:phage/plasmid-like protein (TIGR03299 family)